MVKKVLKPWSMVVNLKTAVIYHGTLALENESTAVNYRIIFITWSNKLERF
jgi:hypothetical protein